MVHDCQGGAGKAAFSVSAKPALPMWLQGASGLVKKACSEPFDKLTMYLSKEPALSLSKGSRAPYLSLFTSDWFRERRWRLFSTDPESGD